MIIFYSINPYISINKYSIIEKINVYTEFKMLSIYSIQSKYKSINRYVQLLRAVPFLAHNTRGSGRETEFFFNQSKLAMARSKNTIYIGGGGWGSLCVHCSCEGDENRI